MDSLKEFADLLAYVQDHGGLMMMFIIAFMVRQVDNYRLNKRIDDVERRAIDRTAVHELYYHFDDTQKGGAKHGN